MFGQPLRASPPLPRRAPPPIRVLKKDPEGPYRASHATCCAFIDIDRSEGAMFFQQVTD